MSDTKKDKRKAKIKRGEATYVRNNPRAKYSRKEKKPLWRKVLGL